MDSNASQVPGLASILQTLAAYTPRQSGAPEGNSELEEGEYDPCQFDPLLPVAAPAPQVKSLTNPTAPPSNISSTQTTVKRSQVPSPSEITTWPKALNYTVQYIFPNPEKKRRIGHLIQTQRKHEREWWASREELIRKARGRDKSRVELDRVLASVGGLVATLSHLEGEAEGDELTKELVVYDRKVHHACRQMVEASNKEICELGVPFFCAGVPENFDREKLKSLRKKMLQLLEDYCGSEDAES